MDGEKLRDGIFALRTRRFGSVAECMIGRLKKCSPAQSNFHDLYDDALRHRIEVKFSVVQKKAERTVTEQTVVRCIEEAVAEKRMVAFPEWRLHQFDCNIQQVKRTEFDVLYYGLFFADGIKIFRIESKEIKENDRGGLIYYSDFQHKGNRGEGQFHINPNTLQIHLDHYLHKTLTYDELYQLLAATD
jgi:hypothetical protein